MPVINIPALSAQLRARLQSALRMRASFQQQQQQARTRDAAFFGLHNENANSTTTTP